jgi:hypothetical protein
VCPESELAHQGWVGMPGWGCWGAEELQSLAGRVLWLSALWGHLICSAQSFSVGHKEGLRAWITGLQACCTDPITPRLFFSKTSLLNDPLKLQLSP